MKQKLMRTYLTKLAPKHAYLITTLNFVPSCSRSERHEQVQSFSHLITTFLPLWM